MLHKFLGGPPTLSMFAKHFNETKVRVVFLPQAILAKDFKGELVSQDPNEESDVVLLQQIKSLKENVDALEMKIGKKKMMEEVG